MSADGGMLPPEMEISQTTQISRATIRIAIRDLVKEGYLDRIPGKGTFIKQKKNSIKFANWLTTEQLTGDAVQNLISWFSGEHHNTEIVTYDIPFESIEKQLMVMIAGGKAPDIASLVYFWIPAYASQGALHPLDSLYDEMGRSFFYSQSIDAITFHNRPYGVNWINAPLILYYNRTILRKYLGIDNLSIDSFDELFDYSQIIYEKSNNSIIPFPISVLDDEVFFLICIYHFLLSFGGGVVNNDNEIIFNSQENIAAYTWLKNIINKGFIHTENDFRKNRILFSQDKIAFIIEGPWFKNMIPIFNPLYRESMDNIGFSILPRTPNGEAYSVLWNHVLSIFQQCKNKELSTEFIRYITTDKKCMEYYYRNTGMLPVDQQEVESNPVYNDPFGKVLQQQMKTALPIPSFHSEFMLSMVFCAKASREILFGDADIPSTLNRCAETIQEIYNL
jgi:multiple sugar transport system substrate-binding protein